MKMSEDKHYMVETCRKCKYFIGNSTEQDVCVNPMNVIPIIIIYADKIPDLCPLNTETGETKRNEY